MTERPERRSPSAARTPLTPEEIVSRSFTTSFRGFDQTEVRDFLQRFADEVRVNTQRFEELDARIAELEGELAKPPVIDEAMVTAYLGEETAKVLQSAHEAANETRVKAESEMRDAVEKANEIRGSYRKEVDEYTAEARAAAEADVQEMLNAASERAQDILDQARSSGRAVLDQVHQLRIKVLQDFSKRRRIAYSQVEQLLAGRDHLLEAVEVVRGNLDDMAAALQQAEADARVAAAAARDRSLEETESEEVELDSLLAPIENPPIMDEEVNPEFVEESEVVDDERSSSALRIIRRKHRNVVHTNEPAKVSANQAAVDELKARNVSRVNIEQTTTSLGDVDEGIRILPREGDEDSDEGEGGDIIDLRDYQDHDSEEPAGEIDDVDTLFAKMRADRERTVEEAERILSEHEEDDNFDDDDDEAIEIEAELDEGDFRATLIGQAAQQREDALDPLASLLGKKMKRLIQNEQNEVLDAIRNQRGRPSGEAIPNEEEQKATYVEAMNDSLTEAVAAGMSTTEGGSSDDIVRRAARDLQQSIVDDFLMPLRQKLDKAISAAPDADDVERSTLDAISAVYREAKNQRVDVFALDILTSAYALGVFSGVDEHTELLWVVDDPMRACPKCDENADSDVRAAGTKFPTGHQLPPAHVGCRCLLVVIPQ